MKSFLTFLGAAARLSMMGLAHHHIPPIPTTLLYPESQQSQSESKRGERRKVRRGGRSHRNTHTYNTQKVADCVSVGSLREKKKKKKNLSGSFWRRQRRDHKSLSNMALLWTCDSEFSFFRLLAPLFSFLFWLQLFPGPVGWLSGNPASTHIHTHILLYLGCRRSRQRFFCPIFPPLLFFFF